MRSLALFVAGAVGAACAATAAPSTTESTVGAVTSPVRLIFLGDVMLGRGVAAVAAADPGSIFEHLRPVLLDADLVLANLESPLTTRPHTSPGFALEADPAVAQLLASVGIDVVDLANNHATDAGPETVLDTIKAIGLVGVGSVGAGADRAAAAEPLIVDVHGVRIGIAAFDLAGGATAGVHTPGVNTWDAATARRSVTALRPRADVVIVGLHGGVEYLPRPDPVLQRVTDELVGWGADVVWGHGAHVVYPVSVTTSERPAVAAPGLGNAVFDQRLPGTDTGTLLEVLADADGAIAERTGTISIEAGRASFGGWDLPDGDAVALDGEWWTPVRPVTEQPSAGCSDFDEDRIIDGLPAGATMVDADCGTVSGIGSREMVVVYRRPTSTEMLQRAFPGRRWADASGLSAHVAVMEPDGRMRWGAGTLLDPVGVVRACGGSLAVGLTSLDDETVTAAQAWTWRGFGFQTSPPLARPGAIGCADIDHDGTTEPFVQRSAAT